MNLNDLNRLMQEFYEVNEKSKNSLTGYYQQLSKIHTLQKSYNRNVKVQAKLTKEISDLEAKRANGTLTEEEKKQLKLKKEMLKISIKQSQELDYQLAAHKSSNKLLNLSLATINSTEKAIFSIGKLLVKNSGYYLEQMRAVRNTERAMGVLNSQTASFRKTLYSASVQTNQIGVDTKMLAEMQGNYSELLGRNIILNETNLIQMSKLHKSTGLSVDNVAEMIALTDGMGMNINSAVDGFDDLTKKANRLGVNQTSVMKKMDGILKNANKYTFKNGLESMKKMALYATKFKMEFDTVAGFADKLFDPEGAIEMGAQLQVLGGKWAQIADPMQLMFKARNDMEGLQKDLITAASGAAEWDQTTKSFKISSLELHRMREAAKMTGISLDELKNTAEQTAKVSHIEKQLGFNASDEVKDMITSMAKMNDDGTFKIRIDGKDVNSRELYKYANRITEMVKESQDMDKKIENAMLFDEKVANLINSFKSTALPIFEAFDTSFSPLFKKITDWLEKSGGLEKVQAVMKKVADGIEWIGKFILNNPMESLFVGASAVLMKGIFELYQWRLAGRQLRNGFDAAGSVFNGSGSNGRSGRNDPWYSDVGKSMGKNGKRLGRGRLLSRAGGKLLRGASGGIGGLVASFGVDALLDSGMIEEDSMTAKLMRIGSKGLEYGGYGGIAGSIIPGLGNGVGATIGAIGGIGHGVYEEFFKNSSNTNAGMANDFIARPGQEPIKFNSADTLVGLKKDGGLGKALIGQGNSSIGNNNTVVSFDKPLEIKGEINLKVNSKDYSNINLSDPLIQRELTRIVQEQLSKNLAGGKYTARAL